MLAYQIFGSFRCAKMPEISPWQEGKDPLKKRPSGRAGELLARLCSHSERERIGDFSFQDIPHEWLERRGNRRLRGKWAGAGGFYLRASILSETAGARDKRKFFNGLIR